MNNKSDYEYHLLSRREHKKCEKWANYILEKALAIYKLRDYWSLKHSNVINYLIHEIGKPEVVLFCSTSNLSQSLLEFNNQTKKNQINLKATVIKRVNSIFTEKVSGFTIFSSIKPIIFINADNIETWPRVLFTIYHELIHCYLAYLHDDYLKLAMQIGKEKMTHKALEKYSSQLRHVEIQTNAIAAMLYVPDYMLNKFTIFKSFRQLQAQFQMSTSAMHNRLFEYFYFKNGWTKKASLAATIAFRNQDLKLISYYRRMLLSKNKGKVEAFLCPLRKDPIIKENLWQSFYFKLI